MNSQIQQPLLSTIINNNVNINFLREQLDFYKFMDYDYFVQFLF